MPRALPGEDVRLNIPLRGTEYQDLQQISRRTSREPGQFAQWLLRLVLAGQLRVAVDELAALEPEQLT